MIINGTHVCIFDAWEYEGPLKLSSRKGREAEVLGKIKAEGGFTIFWATENQLRAGTIDRLEKKGKIVRTDDMKTGYPHCKYRIVKRPKKKPSG